MITLFKYFAGFYINVVNILAPRIGGKQGFFLFCIPFKAKLNDKQQAYLNTGSPSELQVDDIAIMTYRWGNGAQKILFVHGWQSNSYRWKKYIDKIDKQRFTVYAFDAPGHGNSGSLFGNIPLYEKSIRKLEELIGPFDVFVGHSLGSFACFYYLYLDYNSVRKFISLAPPYAIKDYFYFYKSQLKLSDRTMNSLTAYFKEYAGHEVEYYTLERFGPEITAKTLLIHDENDQETPYNSSLKLLEHAKHAGLFTTKGLGHKLRGEEVVDKVMKFIG